MTRIMPSTVVPKVWVIEEGEGEEKSVVAVVSSRVLAIAAIEGHIEYLAKRRESHQAPLTTWEIEDEYPVVRAVVMSEPKPSAAAPRLVDQYEASAFDLDKGEWHS